MYLTTQLVIQYNRSWIEILKYPEDVMKSVFIVSIMLKVYINHNATLWLLLSNN